MLIRYILIALLVISNISYAEPEKLKADNLHARTWNQFAQNILKFHQQRIKKLDVTVKEKTGGYAHLPNFYVQKDYYSNNKLMATVMWERKNPENLHSIEVYVHDKQGRVVRDFTAAYLPNYRNAATQTLISLHRYNNGLHAFRTFDASGYWITDRCTGIFEGEHVDILLDEDEIAEALEDAYIKKGIMLTYEYENCFGNLQQEVGKYIFPQ